MNRYCPVLFCILLVTTVTSGCRTWCPTAGKGNVAAARDLTFHGLNALHHGRAEQAQHLLQRAAEACPDDQRIRQHLATAMVEQGQIDEAIEQLKLAIEVSPHDPRLHVELGNLYLTRKQPQLATRHATIALNINRQAPTAWVLRGRCQAEQGGWQEALASYHRAAGFDCAPDNVQLDIAKAYRELRKPMQALNALNIYNDNFASDQVPVEGVLLTAATLNDLKQHRRAAERLAAAATRPDAPADVWLALSQTQSLTGDLSGALLTARKATRSFPGHTELGLWTTGLDSRLSTQSASERTAALQSNVSL